MRFWLKACPKCRGDLYRYKDRHGEEISCIQCGRELRPEEEARLGIYIEKPVYIPPVITRYSGISLSEGRILFT